MATYLDEIVAAHRAMPAVAVDDAQLSGAPPVRPFAEPLKHDAGLSVIAEIKRRSPSAGHLDEALDPATLAADYARGGASALSVLTDAGYFGGSPEDLRAARAAVALPVLRKDFTVRDEDVDAARAMGADAVLLIVAALDDAELKSLHGRVEALGMAALVEVHDEAELARALDAGADVVGVNQRDLRTFAVDHERALAMAPLIPDHVTKVAESGVRDAADAQRLADAGYDAVLVGQTLVQAGDPAATVRALRGQPCS